MKALRGIRSPMHYALPPQATLAPASPKNCGGSATTHPTRFYRRTPTHASGGIGDAPGDPLRAPTAAPNAPRAPGTWRSLSTNRVADPRLPEGVLTPRHSQAWRYVLG